MTPGQPSLREQLGNIKFTYRNVIPIDQARDYAVLDDKSIDQILALFQQFGEELIGDNDVYGEMNGDYIERNLLRREQRQRLAALVGGEEK